MTWDRCTIVMLMGRSMYIGSRVRNNWERGCYDRGEYMFDPLLLTHLAPMKVNKFDSPTLACLIFLRVVTHRILKL